VNKETGYNLCDQTSSCAPMISGPLPHQATSVATITADQQPDLPIPQLINRIGRNRATELSLTITAEDNSQLPLGTTEQVEETAGFTAPVMFQLPSLEMTIPLVDTFLALSVQIPFSYIPVEKWYVFQAFVAATTAFFIWKRLLHFIFNCCGLEIPHIPQWMRALIAYIKLHLSTTLYAIKCG